MAIKFKYLLLIGFLFLITPFLFAQNTTRFPAQEAGSYVNTESGEPRYMQRFVWSSEYAAMYEVVFYRLENGAYVPFLQEFTNQNYIELSLPVGSYCFLIIPYDVLDKPGEPSEWRYIEIIPVPRDVVPEDTEIEIAKEPEIEPEPVIEPEIEITLEPEFNFEQQAETETKPEPKKIKLFLISFGVSWMPVVPVYGEGFGTELSLLALDARMSAAVRLPVNLYLGLELSANQNFDILSITGGLNLFALKWFPGERIGFGVKFGAAIPVLADEKGYVIGNAGLFFRLCVNKNSLLEIGLDVSHLFDSNASGCFRPWIGFGYQL